MSHHRPHPLMREDTMFGVCAGLAEEFGFSPTLLRLGFAVGLFFHPAAAFAAYAAGAAIVYLAWFLVREPKPAAEAPAVAEAKTAEVKAVEAAEAYPNPLPIAA